MTLRLSERENAVEQINAICLRLFDIWCKSRSMTALTYLLNCWPLMDGRSATIRRLDKTLSELRKTKLETIDAEAAQALSELADWTGEILFEAPGSERDSRAANGQRMQSVSA